MGNKLISTKYPFLPLTVQVRIKNIQGLIDTGFSGDIAIPATGELREYEPDAFATWAMADGSEVMAPVFLGTIHFPDLENEQGIMVGVTITVLGEPIPHRSKCAEKRYSNS